MTIPALFLVALAAAQTSTPPDLTAKLSAGAVWTGTLKLRYGDNVASTAARLTVSKREGTSLEGRIDTQGAKGVVSLAAEGVAKPNGFVEWKIVGIAKAPQEWRDGPGRNIAGLRLTGSVERGTLTLNGRYTPPAGKRLPPLQLTMTLEPKD